jgi:hypothetical protein
MLEQHRCWVFLVFLGGLTVAGCATKPGGAVPMTRDREAFGVWFRSDEKPVRRVLPAPVEAVWAALPNVFADLGYPGGPSARAEERVYLTPPMKVRGLLYQGEPNSVYLDCGRTPAGAPTADVYPITFAILSRLRRQDNDSTLVEVLVDGTARDPAQWSNPVFCTGTGRLETILLQRLEARISTAAR